MAEEKVQTNRDIALASMNTDELKGSVRSIETLLKLATVGQITDVYVFMSVMSDVAKDYIVEISRRENNGKH